MGAGGEKESMGEASAVNADEDVGRGDEFDLFFGGDAGEIGNGQTTIGDGATKVFNRSDDGSFVGKLAGDAAGRVSRVSDIVASDNQNDVNASNRFSTDLKLRANEFGKSSNHVVGKARRGMSPAGRIQNRVVARQPDDGLVEANWRATSKMFHMMDSVVGRENSLPETIEDVVGFVSLEKNHFPLLKNNIQNFHN